jgi:sigma-70-like protein
MHAAPQPSGLPIRPWRRHAEVSRLDEPTIRDFIAGDYRRLVAGLTRLAGDRGTAEEAVQEAMAQAWERSDRGEHIESLTGWVAVVATNLLRSAFRRRLLERRARCDLANGPEERRHGRSTPPTIGSWSPGPSNSSLNISERWRSRTTSPTCRCGTSRAGSTCRRALSRRLHRARQGLGAALGAQILEEEGSARP